MVCVMRDDGPAGPDSLDPRIFCFPLNGERMGIGAGYFYTDQVQLYLLHEELNAHYYIQVSGGGCCWHTSPFQVSAGAQEIALQGGDWTCSPDSCPSSPPAAMFCFNAPAGTMTYPCAGGTPIPQGTSVVLFYDVDDDGPDSSDVPQDTAGFYSDSYMSRVVVLGNGTTNPCYLQIDTLGICIQTRTFHIGHDPVTIVMSPLDRSCVDHSCGATSESTRRYVESPLSTDIIEAYPNPFNPETRIRFTLAAPEAVNLTIYNLAGQRVRTLAAESFAAGEHSLVWDGRTDANTPVGTGLYLCRMTTSHTVSTKSLLLLK
jgi:hypothetical protein